MEMKVKKPFSVVGVAGLEPARLATHDPKSCVDYQLHHTPEFIVLKPQQTVSLCAG